MWDKVIWLYGWRSSEYLLEMLLSILRRRPKTPDTVLFRESMFIHISDPHSLTKLLLEEGPPTMGVASQRKPEGWKV